MILNESFNQNSFQNWLQKYLIIYIYSHVSKCVIQHIYEEIYAYNPVNLLLTIHFTNLLCPLFILILNNITIGNRIKKITLQIE